MIINSCNVLAYRISLPGPKMNLVAYSLIEHYDKFQYFSFCFTSLRYSHENAQHVFVRCCKMIV